MSKRVTLTQRWRKWCWGSEGHPAEPVWANTALVSMLLAFISLILHLGVKDGTISGIALITMCVFTAVTDIICALRRQWFWFWYWTSCVIVGVILFEIASYFFGSLL